MNKENKNKKTTRLNFPKGSKPHYPSQTNGNAKIKINSNTAIPKLKKLSKLYIGVNNPQGFLTDLRIALGIPDSPKASKYGEVTIRAGSDVILYATLRITNHQANAEQYIIHNTNNEYNLSIVIKREMRRNTFKAHDNVRLDEYVYYGKKMVNIENPLTQIIDSIIVFLRTGVYEDTTGIAFLNKSPSHQVETRQ